MFVTKRIFHEVANIVFFFWYWPLGVWEMDYCHKCFVQKIVIIHYQHPQFPCEQKTY